MQKLLLPANLLFSFWESARHLRRLRPDVVLGLGGYVAFPGGMMASLLDRPLALHEQNAIAGLANRVLAGISDKVMVAFPGALKSSGVSSSAEDKKPVLMPPGTTALAFRPFQTPPPCSSISSRAVMPSGCSTQHGLFTCPLMQYSFGP